MFSQLFGKYLVEKEIISNDDYVAAVEKQLTIRVKLGTIAIAEGLLTEEEVETINKLQMQYDKRFGDIAVEKGLLDDAEVGKLLKKQGNPYLQFIEALSEVTGLTAAVLDKTLNTFQKEKGFSDDEMEALKNDDIDVLIPIFAFSTKPHVADLAGLFVRNMNRFVTRDFYIEKIKRVDSLDYTYLAGQKLDGPNKIYVGLAEDADNRAFTMLASRFADEAFMGASADAFDAVCEFININSGLFASELSEKNVEYELEPTFAYQKQTAKGDFYVLPIYIENRKIELIIGVNSEISFGETPYNYSTKDEFVYTANANSRGTVLLVDDSKMSRKMLRAILEDEGYSIIAEAADGIEAVEAFKANTPDLVTLDITMPNMDGIEALQQLRALDPTVKVIMITAAGQQSKLITALKYGAKKFITKPFDKDEVTANVAEVMHS